MPPRVLIVDDEQAFAEIIVELLAGEGYQADRTQSGQAALEWLCDARRAQPDLVICDVMLPDLRGDRIVRAVRDQFPRRHLPFVLLSAGGDPHVELADVWFMSKPLDFGELLTLIAGLLSALPSMGMAAS